MPVAARELELPLAIEDLWLSLGAVPPSRPLMQGDVFEGIAANEQGLVMVITHPCSMRAGSRLRPRQTVVSIQEVKPPDEELAWRTSHYDYMPLPGLTHDAIGNGYPVADFRAIASEETANLSYQARIAALSHEAILHLQQRLAHHLTRAIIDLPTLSRVSDAVLAEVELQEEWVGKATEGVEGDALDEAIKAAEADFQDVLDDEDRRLRTRLGGPHTRPNAIREIRRRIYDA